MRKSILPMKRILLSVGFVFAVFGVVWSSGQSFGQERSDASKSVPTEEHVVSDVLQGFDRIAEPEYPADKATGAHGWTEVAGVYRAPAKATRTVVELHLQWAPNGKVEWGDVVLTETSAPPGRKVRLATVHYR